MMDANFRAHWGPESFDSVYIDGCSTSSLMKPDRLDQGLRRSEVDVSIGRALMGV